MEYKMHPTNTLSISRTAKKLLENIDRICLKTAKIGPKPPNSHPPSPISHPYLIPLYRKATKPCLCNKSRS